MTRRPRIWLMKTEPDVFSFADLCARPGRRELWDGVRNYQARNFMRDDMRVGDTVVFYHSNAEPSGVAGLASIVGEAVPDPSAWDPSSPYFDALAKPDEPRWLAVTVGNPQPLPAFVSLAALRAEPRLAGMALLRRGQRLSILPVSDDELSLILEMARG